MNGLISFIRTDDLYLRLFDFWEKVHEEFCFYLVSGITAGGRTWN